MKTEATKHTKSVEPKLPCLYESKDKLTILLITEKTYNYNGKGVVICDTSSSYEIGHESDTWNLTVFDPILVPTLILFTN